MSGIDGNPAERLRSTAGVQRVPTRELELFILRDFLDPPTCAALVERIDANRRPSTIADDLGIANFRTSETCDLDSRDPLVGGVERKIAELLGLTLQASEPLQGQRYAPGRSSSRTLTRSSRAVTISMCTRRAVDGEPGPR